MLFVLRSMTLMLSELLLLLELLQSFSSFYAVFDGPKLVFVGFVFGAIF